MFLKISKISVISVFGSLDIHHYLLILLQEDTKVNVNFIEGKNDDYSIIYVQIFYLTQQKETYIH